MPTYQILAARLCAATVLGLPGIAGAEHSAWRADRTGAALHAELDQHSWTSTRGPAFVDQRSSIRAPRSGLLDQPTKHLLGSRGARRQSGTDIEVSMYQSIPASTWALGTDGPAAPYVAPLRAG